ncbi:hypothetical protein HanXRQr2_Chr10g0460141 [Helianthus annuus]|uniref:Uncharacterized protein n=1 Tax=Helianthus annuus TaxID=4232 RepID=A0A9K3N5T9_HELAN|nr:hypothetical protein HanXRQr2_Chr10g0460141 [Helianthus annuus]KAJ0885347.1 hypothetical protein HanPSC8_Chr10g0444261 [Helianthus annuus]
MNDHHHHRLVTATTVRRGGERDDARERKSSGERDHGGANRQRRRLERRWLFPATTPLNHPLLPLEQTPTTPLSGGFSDEAPPPPATQICKKYGWNVNIAHQKQHMSSDKVFPVTHFRHNRWVIFSGVFVRLFIYLFILFIT